MFILVERGNGWSMQLPSFNVLIYREVWSTGGKVVKADSTSSGL
jgi:hypothetical protein